MQNHLVTLTLLSIQSKLACALLTLHILSVYKLFLIIVGLFLSSFKKRTWFYSQPPSLFLPATHLPQMELCLKPCSASDVQLAVHCAETLDSISSLSELCVCKVSIAPLSASLNAKRCSFAHHQPRPRPQCGFWMELTGWLSLTLSKRAR